jgi:hypothetical protein
MKYRVFEQAAAEARAGIQELDAEIDRLWARRELLQVLEALVHQVLAVVPMSTEAIPAEAAHNRGRQPEIAVVEQPFCGDSLPEGYSEPLQREESPTAHPAVATADMPRAGQPSVADSLPDGASDSPEGDEPAIGSPATAAAEVTAAEQSSVADNLLDGDSESLHGEASPTGSPGDTTGDTAVAEQPSGAETPAEGDSGSPWEGESSTASPAEATEDIAAAEQPSFADLLWREEPYSLRKRGWPASPPIDEGDIRKKLL